MAESTSSGSKKDMVPINVRDAFGKDPFFSSTWDEFDQMRSDMMSRNKQFWSKVDDDFANFDDTGKSLSEALIFAERGRTCCVHKLYTSYSPQVWAKVIDTKYSKHWPYTYAHTIECVCRKC